MAGGKAVDIIKRSKKRASEPYDQAKLRSSIIAACLSSKTPVGQAEAIADAVLKEVDAWLEPRQVVTSQDLRIVASKKLSVYHPDAAYLYEVHKVIL